jgi:hypothetical protein
MKNIHIIPTDKPSRLYKNINDELSFTDIEFEQEGFNTNQNIYITNDEEIKDQEVHLCVKHNCLHSHKHRNNTDTCEKIILTTDQDLIKDGVQGIDDEFLEWFVNNPSCENVLVELPKSEGDYVSDEHYRKEHIWDTNVRIVIPKKEPTLANIRCTCMSFEPNCFTGSCRKCGFLPKEEPKQETLEEAALIYASKPRKFGTRMTFIDGAKWQQEQDKKMYSEEEVENILIEYVKTNPTKPYRVISWFREFKNK